MTNPKTSNENTQNEISLSETILILKKRWLLLIGLIFLGIIAASIIIFTSPQVYESRASLQMGLVYHYENLSSYSLLTRP